jgi:hypothetical protein
VLLNGRERVHMAMVTSVQVLSSLQLAQASVTSYPFFPDALQMSSIIEAELSAASSVPLNSDTMSAARPST